jgi:2-oxoglutarate ferredoxin oxidoreductase subunit delta
MSKETTVEQEAPPVITIHPRWCKGCAICVELCPKKVLAMEDGRAVVVDLEACNRCQLCDLRCPDFAITVR